jgi:uncharacterized protein YbbC (DUF1343 family)
MNIATGLDRLVRDDLKPLSGKSIGVVCNQASITKDCEHILEFLIRGNQRGKLCLKAIFGPQHGLFGHTQDNMIEWESSKFNFGVPLYSLYGEHREPTPQMLDGIEVLVIDLQCVGARYYTFIWTLALCIKACEKLGIEILILDRPNPIGGVQVEGTVLDPEFSSFVGLYPLPIRHGLTLAEIGAYLQAVHFPAAEVSSICMEGWSREVYFDKTDLVWGMPSPNMPSVSTALVYPGGCLLEATNLSEGRGTTRPFELVGAPYVDGRTFCESLNAADLHGVRFRPIEFEPTFQKHAKQICEGAFVHVTSRAAFEPVLAYVAVMQEAIRQAGSAFAWNPPPYEYETIKLPIDILAGNLWLRHAIEDLTPLSEIRNRFREECAAFELERAKHLIY